jgi:hypothetical protein
MALVATRERPPNDEMQRTSPGYNGGSPLISVFDALQRGILES